MENDLISFETAKTAKEKGFNFGCTYYYDFSGSIGSGREIVNRINWNKSNDSIYSAPTQSQIQKWLRVVHGIHIEILLEENSPYNKFYYRIMRIGEYFTLSHDGTYSNYYEGILEIAIQKGLMLI